MKKLFLILTIIILLFSAASCTGESPSASLEPTVHPKETVPEDLTLPEDLPTEPETKWETEPASESTAEPPSDPPSESSSEEPYEDAIETDGSYARAIAKKNQEFDPATAVIEGDRTPNEAKNYTVMVYMIGSNLESALGSASSDIAEMTAAGIDYEKTNLILYTGGSTRWQTGVPCDRNSVLDMSLPEKDRIVAGTKKNADMGAKETLTEFVNFCTDRYPASHYALILWDHGGGPLFGYGSDELFNGDGLTLEEMRLAMKKTVFAGTKDLDFVGFDACMMGSLETMTVWSEFARYFVGSEELEPGDGWDYRFLSRLNETDESAEITGEIIARYRSYYEEKKSDHYDPDLTLAVSDLAQVEKVHSALAFLSKKMTESLGKGTLSALFAGRKAVKSFGLSGDPEEKSLQSFDLADLKDLAAVFSESYPKEAADLAAAVDRLVLLNYANTDGAGGVSVYFPSENYTQYYEMRGEYEGIAENREYLDLLKKINSLRLSARSDGQNLSLSEPVRTEKGFQVTIPEDSRNAVVSCYSTILLKKSDGAFVTVLERSLVEPDENGVILLDADPTLIAMTTGNERTLWPVIQTESTKKRRTYRTLRTRLLSSGISYFTRPTSEAVNVQVTLTEDLKTGKLSIKTTNSVSEDVAESGKETVNVSHYDAVFYYYNEKLPSWNASGALFPVSEWNENGVSGSLMRFLPEEFGFTAVKASELPEELYFLVTAEDAAGNVAVTEPVRLSSEKAFRTVTVSTDRGELTFAVYPDHAELISYLGTDEAVVLPETVNGTPLRKIGADAFSKLIAFSESGHLPVKSVTIPDSVEEIGEGAFFHCLELKEVQGGKGLKRIGARAFQSCTVLQNLELPDGLLEIGGYAFSECDALTTISLPAGIERIGKGFLSCTGALEEILLPGSNPNYQLWDGVLFTRDLKDLLQCPAKKSGTFELPSATERILSDAFSKTCLSHVSLSESLLTIENYAFFGAKALHVPVFPEHLQSVGKYAFSAGWNEIALSGNDGSPETVFINQDLTYIGTEAFAGFPVRRFFLSSENPRYSEKDGALLSKTGDALVEFAANKQKSFVIPEGVRDFDLGILDAVGEYDRLDDDAPFRIYLPADVIRITGHTVFTDDLVFHCPEGSFAEEYALREGIRVSYDTDPVRSVVREKTENGELTYHLTEKNATLIHYEGNDAALALPETVNGLPLTVLGDGLNPVYDVKQSANVRKIVFPEAAEIIQAHAFEGLGELEAALPSRLKVLGDFAFDGTVVPITSLPDTIEDIGEQSLGYGAVFASGFTVGKSVKRIAPGAFSGVPVTEFNLAKGQDGFAVRNGMLYSDDGTILLAARIPDANGEIEIPAGTRVIGTRAFSAFPITKIDVPSSVELIAQYAFSYCTLLTEVSFHEGLKNVGSYSFIYSGIEELTLPESCTRIGIAAFFGCTSLRSASFSASTVETYAFGYDRSLFLPDLREGVETLGDYAFFETAAEAISLPDSLSAVGRECFGNESGFTRYFEAAAAAGRNDLEEASFTLNIGKNLQEIGAAAFGSLSISDVQVSEENPNYASADGCLTDRSKKRLLFFPALKGKEAALPDGIREIGDGAFRYACRLTDLSVPASVDAIAPNAFRVFRKETIDGVLVATLHVAPDSQAYRFAIENGWPYVVDEKQK